jgi:thiamine biosynthesis lipoprotein
MEIDLGAIAKGYIADRVRDFLGREGVTQALINLGGNVHTLGAPQGGWGIGLKKPFSTADALVGLSMWKINRWSRREPTSAR